MKRMGLSRKVQCQIEERKKQIRASHKDLWYFPAWALWRMLLCAAGKHEVIRVFTQIEYVADGEFKVRAEQKQCAWCTWKDEVVTH